MSRRWWGLTARQTLVLFAVAILVGVGVALVVGPGGGDDHGGDGGGVGRAPSVARVRVGSRGAADAVWVFGFETLRFDLALRRGGQLGIQGFGDVTGGSGAVYLYDAGSGRLGVLDATRNRLRELPARVVGSSGDAAFVDTLALGGAALWVAPDPGVVVRVDPALGVAGPPIPVAAGPVPSSTGLTATDSAVYAATVTGVGVEVARIDPDTGAVTRGVVAGAPTLDGLAADDGALWVRSGARLHELDPERIVERRSVAVPRARAAGGLGGLVTADGDVWMLADGGASLLRYRPGPDRFTRAARLLDRRPAGVELPAALVSDGRHVVAMVQRRGASDLAVRLVVHDPARGRTRAVDVPGGIASGAVAVTTRRAGGGPP